MVTARAAKCAAQPALLTSFGGGSSDAAVTFIGLQRLFKRSLPFEQIPQVLRDLGSDVPFFTLGGRAAGYGRGDEVSPGPKVQTDAEIDAWIRKVAATANHPASTCLMGTGPDTVLDPQMRVRGTERLRVVDASAMPDLVSAHINACVLMMAEKASDVIRGRPALAPVLDA